MRVNHIFKDSTEEERRETVTEILIKLINKEPMILPSYWGQNDFTKK